MHIIKSVVLAAITVVIFSCKHELPRTVTQWEPPREEYDTVYTINTSGYYESGEVVTKFDCPDSRFFPPIDIRSWQKTPAVNGRFPTYKETITGKAIHTYGGKNNRYVKLYTDVVLPKLAYYTGGPKQKVIDKASRKVVEKPQVVVVIQMARTLTDTLVSFRYLTGGVGGSYLRDFRFLNDKEAKELVEQYAAE